MGICYYACLMTFLTIKVGELALKVLLQSSLLPYLWNEMTENYHI